MEIKKFEVNKKYGTVSAYNSQHLEEIEVIKRTEKTITVKYDGEVVRRKIHIYNNEEFIKDPCIGANDNYEEAKKKVEERIQFDKEISNKCNENKLKREQEEDKNEIIEMLKGIDRKILINTLISYGADKKEIYNNAFNIEELGKIFLNISKENQEKFLIMSLELMEYIK